MKKTAIAVALWLLPALGISQTKPETMGTHATSEAKTVVIRTRSLIDGTGASPVASIVPSNLRKLPRTVAIPMWRTSNATLEWLGSIA